MAVNILAKNCKHGYINGPVNVYLLPHYHILKQQNQTVPLENLHVVLAVAQQHKD